jgi:hypothetical protein
MRREKCYWPLISWQTRVVTFDQPYQYTWNSWVFLRTFHISHKRRARQVTVVTQHILQNRDYDHNCKANDNDKDYILTSFWSLEPPERREKSQVSVQINCVGIRVAVECVCTFSDKHPMLCSLCPKRIDQMLLCHEPHTLSQVNSSATELSGRHPQLLCIQNV